MAYTSIDDPSAYFQVKTYSGNGTDNTAITNDGNSNLQPDWWIVKRRAGGTSGHAVYDSTRGVTKRLNTNLANAEDTQSDRIKSFDTNGFTLGTNEQANASGSTYVAWQWKCNGGTTSSNTTGTITSTVQANSDAGFNIVTYTGNGSNSNFAHGMSEQPDMVIVKNRDSVANWCVWHKGLTSSYYVKWDDSISEQTGPWDGLDPSSAVVYVYSGGLVNASGSDYVAYIFKSKQGYSKFGKYTGNGNAEGPFVYLGFKPAFVIIKNKDRVSNWVMYDTKREPFNVMVKELQPNTTAVENDDSPYSNIDFLSNGFKLRGTGYNANLASGEEFIYMAFAENPFVTSTGIPTTAR